MAVLDRKDQIRNAALNDLETFIKLVHPQRVLGQAHKDLISWWTRDEAKTHQLILLPRDHQKSALAAYRVAWEITRNPAIRILYISSTQNLAVKQLKFIKDILTSDIYRFYWPEMVNLDESKREKWTESEISVDHPKRKLEIVRDPTVFTAGLTTTITGLHCDLAVLDDVVVDENAYTEEGRTKVRDQAGYLASIAGTEARLWAVGTRYHPKDLYADFSAIVVSVFNNQGELTESYSLYETYEKVVEDRGDGTGNFLWPRMQDSRGKWFGFDARILAEKKAQYHDQARFRAQYYNNPNDLSNATITPDMFQYYNRNHLKREFGKWFMGSTRLNVFAAVDFAYSTNSTSDYSAIVVVGVDGRNNYYILDIDRFKTDKISDYFDRILRLHQKWDFRKLRAEVTAAQKVIVKDLKDNHIRVHGLALSVEDYTPGTRQGSKEERIESTLQPKYANKQVWHYAGGNCELLEEELVMRKPAHDDIKDCLASCIDFCIPPTSSVSHTSKQRDNSNLFHSRFGGVTG